MNRSAAAARAAEGDEAAPAPAMRSQLGPQGPAVCGGRALPLSSAACVSFIFCPLLPHIERLRGRPSLSLHCDCSALDLMRVGELSLHARVSACTLALVPALTPTLLPPSRRSCRSPPRRSLPTMCSAAASPSPPPSPPPSPTPESADGTLVQYVVVRRDLLKTMEWPTGSVIAQASVNRVCVPSRIVRARPSLRGHAL